MKKLILLMVFACCTAAMKAQNPIGGLSIKPMAGVNISGFVNGTDEMYSTKVGFTGGAELEYGVNRWLGMSLGMIYSQQGAKIDADAEMTVIDDTGQRYYVAVDTKGKLKCNYLNLPLMANVYIPAVKGLAVKAGVQVGILTSDRITADVLTATVKPLSDYQGGVYASVDDFATLTSQRVSQSDVCKSLDFGIPVGLSYEFKNVSLDARYYFGLKKIDKTEDPDNARNGCLSITLGYRFHL